MNDEMETSLIEEVVAYSWYKPIICGGTEETQKKPQPR
jgi:hypothetical protein